ncbi:hypothetical protein FQA39_LY08060 [Lamprigera yunnana]|nr:hypothetical protein FQA39_LY08060 [Lamprigera yunnana]
MIMDYKEGEIRNFQESRKEFIKNYWGTKEESVMKSELYGTKFNHGLRQLEEELHKKVRIIEVKKFDKLVRILELHFQCDDRKTREMEGQEKIHILPEEEIEEQTEIEKRIYNCKEDKVMQMLIQTMEQNSAQNTVLVNKMEETNQKLDETRSEIRTEINQSIVNNIEEKTEI